jgi:hypothetical protein
MFSEVNIESFQKVKTLKMNKDGLRIVAVFLSPGLSRIFHILVSSVFLRRRVPLSHTLCRSTTHSQHSTLATNPRFISAPSALLDASSKKSSSLKKEASGRKDLVVSRQSLPIDSSKIAIDCGYRSSTPFFEG